MLRLNVFHNDVTMELKGSPAEIMAELSVVCSGVIERVANDNHKSYGDLLGLFLMVMQISKKGR